MKKILSFVATLAVIATMTAQTFVDTTAQPRNAVIEEFTGVNCQYCPDGHKIVNQLIAANPGRVVAINIHQGGYAARYTTQWGDAIANQTGISGWPSGTVNRHVFSGSNTVLGRGDFASATNIIMGYTSPVNVAAKAHVNLITRTIEIDVEAYYTAAPANDTNKLNVAILQDNIIGPQVGASDWYPEMMVGSQYRHNHMLRDLITGQWGEDITPVAAGTFVSRHYTYEIPAQISDVDMKAQDLKVVVFIAEGRQEILTGCEATMSYYGLYTDPMIVDGNRCATTFAPKFVVHNYTNERATDITFNYSYSGEANTYVYTDTMAANSTDTIELPTYAPNTKPEATASYNIRANAASYTRVLGTTEYDTTINNTYRTDTLNIDTTYTYDTLFSYTDTNTGRYREYYGHTRYDTLPGLHDTVRVDTNMHIAIVDTTLLIQSDTIIDSIDFRTFNIGGATNTQQLMTVYTVQAPIHLIVVVDKYSTETSVDFVRQSDCTVLFESEPIPDDLNRNAMQTFYHFDPDTAGLYILTVYDAFGDGNKGVQLRDGTGNIISSNGGNIGTGITYHLNIVNNGSGEMLGIEPTANATPLSLYPNPVRDELRIDCGETISSLDVMDLTGRVVMHSASSQTTLSTATLPNGMYILRATTASGISVQKFVKQ